jgi:transketolase
MNKLIHNRLIDISYKYKLSHLSSCITSLPIIYDIYKNKDINDIFILSNGHAGLALYVVLEYFLNKNAEQLYDKHGTHPNYDIENGIFCSTGSLGLGLPIGIGYALSNSKRKVYVLISDGEAAEGSVWEALNFINNKNISNIEVHANINGHSAYEWIDKDQLATRLKVFLPNVKIHYTNLNEFPLLMKKGIESHYCIINNEKEKQQLLI